MGKRNPIPSASHRFQPINVVTRWVLNQFLLNSSEADTTTYEHKFPCKNLTSVSNFRVKLES